ncbi:hypothetical protein HD597_000969 [Nonomuraea thailandensis]|uniref:Uncharacterized protein n=1 Tax=Nonomuraea thailandensis TaxID=1188745 RepID=A0A9X2JZ87_9ACTN|nr:hypothetical protein [Nonomuraea thailandensis]
MAEADTYARKVMNMRVWCGISHVVARNAGEERT